MDKPRCLDLFCGAGGATRGLQEAGFYVIGVDIAPQKRYVGDEFHQADAMTFPLEGFDFIWASPPCQGYSRLRHLPWLKGKVYPLLINSTRERLRAAGVPWVIENVEDAAMKPAIFLCGTMFGLSVYRHRLFQTSCLLLCPNHLKHQQIIGPGRMLNDRGKGSLNASSGKGAWGNSPIVTVAGGQFKKADGERAMQIDWMTKPELAQAIPPAYSRYIGEQMMPHVLRQMERSQ